MKKFKSKKKTNNFLIYFALFLVSISLSIRYLYKNNRINDDTLVQILVNDNLGKYENSIGSVDFLIKYALNIDLDNKETDTKEEKVEKTNVIEEKEEVVEIKELVPLVYIYNTHSTEKYQNSFVGSYNVTPSVTLASKILKEYLEKLDIGVIVEEENTQDRLNVLGWSYGKSYQVSRIILENAHKNNPTLQFFIDLHRDSSKYNITTTNIDGKKFAKILFVLGLDNPNYEQNLIVINKLNERLKEYNLSRGILEKKGKGVNGIYNQDYNNNAFLIEVGGQDNTIDEVNNTLEIFANILSEYIKEDNNG